MTTDMLFFPLGYSLVYSSMDNNRFVNILSVVITRVGTVFNCEVIDISKK